MSLFTLVLDRPPSGLGAHREQKNGLVLALIANRRERRKGRFRSDPATWPAFRLWATPEGMIVDIVEKYYLLRRDRVDDVAAFTRIDEARGRPDPAVPVPFTLTEYLWYRLDLEGTGYQRLGQRFLRSQVEAVCAFFDGLAPQRVAGDAVPPREWLVARHTVAEIEASQTEIYTILDGVEARARLPFDKVDPRWETFKLRLRPDDELWSFSAPPDPIAGDRGPKGVALVRDGVPLAAYHIG